MTHHHHTGPWAHPTQRREIPPEVRALRCMKWACLIALVALLAVIAADKAIPQAAYDAVNHEVMQ